MRSPTTPETEDNPEIGPVAASRILGVNPDTIRRYAMKGLLPARRLPSGRVRFRLADVERAAAERA